MQAQRMRIIIALALLAFSCSGIEDAEPAQIQRDADAVEAGADADVDAETASCTPGQTECRDRGIWYCDQSAAWTLGRTCETACVNAACTTCQPGVVDCVGGDVVVCSASGDYVTLESCRVGDVCVGTECCTPDCAGRTCGHDGCGGECGPECRTGAECLGGVCADIACGADPALACVADQCAGIGRLLFGLSGGEHGECWQLVREEYIRNGCPTGSLFDFYCRKSACEYPCP